LLGFHWWFFFIYHCSLDFPKVKDLPCIPPSLVFPWKKFEKCLYTNIKY
jgi:hypothetical protein